MIRRTIMAVFLGLIVLQTGFITYSKTKDNTDNIRLIRRSAYLITQKYYDDTRIKPKKMMEEGFFSLAKKVPEVLPQFRDKALNFKLGDKEIQIPITKTEHLYDILPVVSQAFEFLENNYKGKIKIDEMEYAFLDGMVEVLDPHTRFFPPAEEKELKAHMTGNYGGLGIVLGYENYKLTVLKAFDDTPAYRGGLKSGDVILQIDDYSASNIGTTEAVELMRGKPGTKIVLKIKSLDGSVRNVAMIREKIEIKSVEGKVIEHGGKKIGVLRLKSFQHNTLDEFRDELSEIKKQDVSGFILDVRQNVGGVLGTSTQITDRFLRNGVIVSTIYGGENEDFFARNQFSDLDWPMMVLVDEGSASASEIVAGALKNNKRAVLLGRTTFGKGSVQEVHNMENGTSLKITVAEYLNPGRQSIQAVGVVPDIYVYPSYVNPKRYDLKEDEYYSEAKVDAHYESKNVRGEQKPAFRMTYVEEKEVERDRGEQFEVKIKDDDYELQLAVKLLASVDTADTEQMLKKFQGILKKEKVEQEKALVSALKKQNIAWEHGQDAKQPRLQMSHLFLDKNKKPVSVFEAGQTYEMKLSLKNSGSKPVYQVLASLESLNSLLDNREFVFGKINPDETKTQTVSFEVPHEVSNFEEKTKVNVYTELTEESPRVFAIATKFHEKPAPKLAYSYKIYDGNGHKSKGNSNGLLDVGETVVIATQIKNLSEVDSEETMVSFYNKSKNAIFLNNARENIGKLDSQKEKTVYFSFDVKSEPVENSFYEFQVYAADNLTQTYVFDSLRLHVSDVNKDIPQPELLQQPPQIVFSEESVRKNNFYKLIGEVVHDTKLKDIAVFVDGKKVFYQNLEKMAGLKKRDLDLLLPLKEGLNSITVQARGLSDISATKTLSVVFDPNDIIARNF